MSSIIVEFTGPALKQVNAMTSSQTDGQDPKQWHIDKVQAYAAANASSLPGVTKGRVRAAAHKGGTDPNEKDHITVTFKARNKEIETQHVYTGRS